MMLIVKTLITSYRYYLVIKVQLLLTIVILILIVIMTLKIMIKYINNNIGINNKYR